MRKQRISDATFKKQFEAMAKILCTVEEICAVIGISNSSLDDYCQRVYGLPFNILYQRFTNSGRMSLRRAQYASAVKSRNVTMQIWLGKQWLGQRENGSPHGGDSKQTEFDIREGLYRE